MELMHNDIYPLIDEGPDEFDTRPQCNAKIAICFMCEEESWLTCNIQNEILVPWYDCEVKSIYPDDDYIRVWLDDYNYLKKNYPQHIMKKEGDKE